MSKLKYRRTAAGLTQKQLAEAAGISIRLLQEYEQGRKDLNRAQVQKALALANALGVRVEEILPEE